ncbi:MAG: DUF2973 domain-containing protein [Coleofasciculus sp. C3-bin4]|jgi:hypothetical protein|nr:DUF2973 domain-containing protein [Coleofasciculus sp. C3-bin4]
MLHLLYLVAFTVIAFLAIGNLLRSLLTLSIDSHRRYSPAGRSQADWGRSPVTASRARYNSVPHPELLDDKGNPINEPLLVMRSMTVEDAREQLDAIFNSSPGNRTDSQEER